MGVSADRFAERLQEGASNIRGAYLEVVGDLLPSAAVIVAGTVIALTGWHAWTITSGVPVLSAHVAVDDDTITGGHTGRVLDALGHCLAHHFDVEHSTFQVEPYRHCDHETALHP